MAIIWETSTISHPIWGVSPQRGSLPFLMKSSQQIKKTFLLWVATTCGCQAIYTWRVVATQSVPQAVATQYKTHPSRTRQRWCILCLIHFKDTNKVLPSRYQWWTLTILQLLMNNKNNRWSLVIWRIHTSSTHVVTLRARVIIMFIWKKTS